MTPELKEHFDHIGEELVMRDVSNHRYTKPEKHFAAVYWLGEQRRRRERHQAATHRLVKWALIIATATLIVTIANVAASIEPLREQNTEGAAEKSPVDSAEAAVGTANSG